MLRSGMAASAIGEAAEVSEEALAALSEADGVRAFVEGLAEEEGWEDAIAFLSHALPTREAVWWAWNCAKEAASEAPGAALAESLDATKKWIAEPTDANRRDAMDAAMEAGLDTPVGMAALAAFLCGDTLGPADAPAAPPPVFAAAKAIAGCLHLSAAVAAAEEDADLGEGYAAILEKGLGLADRVELWTPPDGAAPPAGGGS